MQRIDEEAFLAFMRLLARVQRVPADLPGGRQGNVIERAFYNCLIGLWRTRHGAHMNEDRLIQLALAEPFMRYLDVCPEDELAPELRPFMETVARLRAADGVEAKVVREGHGGWLALEAASNPQLREYLWLLDAVRGIIRELPVAGRPEAKENDAEHSVWVALGLWYLDATFPLHRPIDRAKGLVYALIHDLLEAPPGAGDTPVTGPSELLATKRQREEAGVCWIEERFGWLGRIIREYMEQGNATAVAANHVDKVEPWAVIGFDGRNSWARYGYAEGWLRRRQQDKCPSPDLGGLGLNIGRVFIEAFGSEVSPPQARAG